MEKTTTVTKASLDTGNSAWSGGLILAIVSLVLLIIFLIVIWVWYGSNGNTLANAPAWVWFVGGLLLLLMIGGVAWYAFSGDDEDTDRIVVSEVVANDEVKVKTPKTPKTPKIPSGTFAVVDQRIFSPSQASTQIIPLGAAPPAFVSQMAPAITQAVSPPPPQQTQQYVQIPASTSPPQQYVQVPASTSPPQQYVQVPMAASPPQQYVQVPSASTSILYPLAQSVVYPRESVVVPQ